MMNEKEIKDCLEFAKSLVKDEIEPFKTESFKIILTYLLNTSFSTTKTLTDKKSHTTEKLVGNESKESEISSTNVDKIFLDLAKEVKITVEQLHDSISFHNNKLEILTSFQGSNKSEKTIKAISCILLLYEKFFKNPWVKSEVIAEHLRDLGIPDTGKNMSAYMKQNSNLFRARDSGRYKEYKLTTTEGKASSFEVLKEISS